MGRLLDGATCHLWIVSDFRFLGSYYWDPSLWILCLSPIPNSLRHGHHRYATLPIPYPALTPYPINLPHPNTSYIHSSPPCSNLISSTFFFLAFYRPFEVSVLISFHLTSRPRDILHHRQQYLRRSNEAMVRRRIATKGYRRRGDIQKA